jgi:hypothetical protein
MSLEAGTPQQHRGLWEATFEAPNYAANFKEERGDRNIVHWKSVHDNRKVGQRTRQVGSPNTSSSLINGFRVEFQRIDRVLSKSYVASRSEQEKEEIVAKIKQIQTTSDDGKEWIDREVSVCRRRCSEIGLLTRWPLRF